MNATEEQSNGKKVLWIVCPNCKFKLAKQIGPGRYETKMKKRKDVYFCAEIVIGTITCSTCGFVQPIPAVAVECDEKTERKQ
jgi:C4-type Zn-finger protein